MAWKPCVLTIAMCTDIPDVTDWEHLRLRTVNGTAESADFNTHSGGAFSAGTLRWEEVERTPDDRPVAYIASGSHGVWPVPGRHVYAQVSDASAHVSSFMWHC